MKYNLLKRKIWL